MRLLRTALFCVAATGVAACHSNLSAPSPLPLLTALPRPLSADEQTVLQGSNAFAFNLFAAVDSEEGPDSNAFVSPLSASMALGMTAVGAAGTTLDSMQRVLGFGGMSVNEMGSAYQTLIALLQSVDTNVTFDIANAIWYDNSISPLPAFSSTVATDFNARLQAADLSSSATTNAINQWVDSSTHGKIPTLLDGNLSDDMVAFLANAIYFHGLWSLPFDTKQTRDSTFTTSTGASASVPMMHLQKEYGIPLQSGPGYTAIDLPYGRNAYRMAIILPAAGVSLDSVTHAMRDGGWAALSQVFDTTTVGSSVTLALPKFQTSWSDSLSGALSSLGMGIAFSQEADFSNLATNGPFNISTVIQKTFVSVDESGTTAAAVTGVGIVATAEPIYTSFSANHPFLYVIHERLSGAILFIGTYTHPPAS